MVLPSRIRIAAPRVGLAVTMLFAAAASAAEGAPDPTGTVPSAPVAGDAYDPWQGVDHNGRIPAIHKPDDLPNPERWRYIPEGRIKPGNIFQRFLVSSFIVPFFFRSSDVGWGGGLAITDIDFRTQRRREFAGIFASYTEEQQQAYWIVWRRWLHHIDLPQGGVLQEERSLVRGSGGYAKTLTHRFYGFGADSNSKDQTRYSDNLGEFSMGMQHAWPEPGDDLVLRGGLRGEFHDLGRGVGSQPDTKDVYPFLFGEAKSRNLGYLDAGVSWDTRDSQVNPYGGWEVAADVEAALLQSNWDVGALYTLKGSKIFAVPGLFHEGGDKDEANPPTDTIALGVRTEFSSGDLPFFALPSLGGDKRLRGYVAGRFRDDAAWYAAAEYRFWVLTRGIPIWGPIRIERVGLAAFYELGSVANKPRNLFESKVRQSYGGSLRVTLERSAPFRIDFGFAPDQSLQLIARFGLSF